MIHRKPNRMVNYNYSSPGFYFLTICVHNRESVFGRIIDSTMELNGIGLVAQECWQAIPEHFPDSEIDEFVIMPNHIHGIVRIDGNNSDTDSPVGVADLRPLRGNRNFGEIDRTKMTLPKIIHGFKSSVTRIVHQKFDAPFRWQRSYHDRIIRNEKELFRIRNYIEKNPKNWDRDRLNRMVGKWLL